MGAKTRERRGGEKGQREGAERRGGEKGRREGDLSDELGTT
jgi:hypothetical protein